MSFHQKDKKIVSNTLSGKEELADSEEQDDEDVKKAKRPKLEQTYPSRSLKFVSERIKKNKQYKNVKNSENRYRLKKEDTLFLQKLIKNNPESEIYDRTSGRRFPGKLMFILLLFNVLI